MLKDVAKNLMQKLEFPLEEQNELLVALDKLLETNDFESVVSKYGSDDFDFMLELENIKTIAQKKDIDVFTANMLFLICMTPKLHEKYIYQGIDDKIFYDTMLDLKYKLQECRLVHNRCGTFVASWYKGFFDMKIFALGRLQFEINHTWFDCEVNDRKLPKGTKVLSVHIPRTGTRLDHNLVLESYKQAKQFFENEFETDIIFICNSWLLDTWNRKFLNDGSNLAQFYDDFTIVQTGNYRDYSETWRLFDCLYTGNLDDLPCDTSLRRAYIERIKSGLPTGYATGVILNI